MIRWLTPGAIDGGVQAPPEQTFVILALLGAGLVMTVVLLVLLVYWITRKGPDEAPGEPEAAKKLKAGERTSDGAEVIRLD